MIRKEKKIYGTQLRRKKRIREEGIDLLSIPWVSKDN